MESQFHTTGSPVWVWVNNEQGWLKASVQKVESDGKLQVRLDSGTTASFKPEDCPLRNVESRMGVEVFSYHSLVAQGFCKFASV